jgi:hypothetical protein
MTTWNLRVLEIPHGASSYYEVREVYYNNKGEPFGHSRATLQAESKEALHKYLAWAIEATEKPTFRETDLVPYRADYTEFQ